MTNLTDIQNMTGAYDMGAYANNFSNGLFWSMMIIAIFIILIINMRRSGIGAAVASSSFACLLISLFLVYLEWVTVLFPIVFAIITAASILYLKQEAR